MIAGIIHNGSGLGNQLHRYIMTRVLAMDKNLDWGFIGKENFKGYTCEFDKKVYFKDAPCFVIQATPKRSPWYYSKRVLWVDKNTGAGIYEEMYDPNGKMFRVLFKDYEIYKVDGKEYPLQIILEGKDLRTGHRTTIVNSEVKLDKGLSENLFTDRALMQSRW